jgi:hypothetical protein
MSDCKSYAEKQSKKATKSICPYKGIGYVFKMLPEAGAAGGE